jgi:hypothetical protein
MRQRTAHAPAIASIVLALSAGAADAKSARCFTTDDGYYPCRFTATDGRGSFEIAARGYPTYSLVVDRPGFAFGYADYEGRSVSLPGQYVRSRDDGACWLNPETDSKICAW